MQEKNITSLPLELSSDQRRAIYAAPVFLPTERDFYFNLTAQESKFMRSLDNSTQAVYFIISLAYFKKKKTLVKFTYQSSTHDRRYVMKRYFLHKAAPTNLPSKENMTKLDNKVLAFTGYKRINAKSTQDLQRKLNAIAKQHPKQNQLFQALLDLMISHQIAIPGYRSMQEMISHSWNKTLKQLIDIYYRHTNKQERQTISALMLKTERTHQIISIRKDMKNFSTQELRKELEKHQTLKSIFDTALTVIPKFNLPDSTLEYYASLINYYGGWKLKYINNDYAQIYLLCYSHMRYQTLNDNLMDAFKKHVRDYERDAQEYVREQALTYQDDLQSVKKRLSALLVTIHNISQKSNTIPVTAIFQHISQLELLPIAKQLNDEAFDKKEVFWQFIEDKFGSIKLNLRPLFFAIDFVFTNHQLLEKIVTEIKSRISTDQFNDKTSLPAYINDWVPQRYQDYIISNGVINYKRLEFYLYRQLSYRVNANDISLKYSFQHKRLEDDLTPQATWQKDKKKMLRSLGYEKLLSPISKTLSELKKESTLLYHTVNQRISNNENTGVKVSSENNVTQWRLSPLKAQRDEYANSLFSEFQPLSIVDIIRLVGNETRFLQAFDPVTPRGHKSNRDPTLIMAVVLANAIRIGTRKMAENSDLNLSELLTAESAYVRVETLKKAIDIINNAAAKLPIFKEWHINGVLHGSMDGTKIETMLENIKARSSQKYFLDSVGVSSFNMIANSLPLSAILIGSHEYEGHFSFELFQHGNTSDIKPVRQSGDGHAMNQLNFALFHMVDKLFMPRIPKIHRETLYAFGSLSDYKDYLIKPDKILSEKLIAEEWDNIQRIYHALISGNTRPSVIIKKLSAHTHKSRTKKAFWQFNNILKSIYLLKFIDDEKIRQGVTKALNRGEAYHNLCAAIGLHKGGKLKGYSEIDLAIWNECTRLIASIITYYNTYILSTLFITANKHERKFLINASPIAWAHINFIGFYQFYSEGNLNLEKWIKAWNWKKSSDFVENMK
ncbi:MAG: Tn3 family transposase [Taibaiella sp.]